MLRTIKFVGGFAIMLVLAALLSSCSSGRYTSPSIPSSTGNAPWTTQAVDLSAGNSVTINLVIKDVTTPEGPEPAYVGQNGVGAANLFSVKANVLVKVTIDNQDAMPHTFSVPSLGLNIAVNPLSKSKFTFEAKTVGTLDWDCEVPCGSWVMSHAGYMKGEFSVTA